MKLLPRLPFLSLFLSSVLMMAAACGARTASMELDAGPTPSGGDDLVVKPPPPPTPDVGLPRPPATPLLQAVLSDLKMPARGTDYARDIDGDGRVDNALGALLGQITSFLPMSLDEIVGDILHGGAGFLLFEIYGEGLNNSSSAEVRLRLGEDADDNPGNNFTGQGVFVFSNQMLESANLYGGIRNGQLAAEGDLFIPLTQEPLTMSRGFLLAESISPKGLFGGTLNGAIPWETVQEVLLPLFADAMSQGGLPPQLASFFDTNGDGRISAEELQK
ncbi:MAG: hypothetical protein JRH20_28910, partial [Deltaproteobacteria bacterium]|nr:hypothetical protein [Deltaproteobacteria bacterium]